MTSAFSSSESSALERETEDDVAEILGLQQVWNETHKMVCSGWIIQYSYKKFPDNYLKFSVAITDSLKAAVEGDVKVFILADTSYGSYCVNEIAAAHVESDSLIHFGNACRSKVARLPVLYMYPELPFSLEEFMENLQTIDSICEDKEICIYFDIGYHRVLDKEKSLCVMLREKLSSNKIHIEAYPIADESKCDYEPAEDRVCIFVGEDNSRFASLSLTTKAAHWLIYDPVQSTINEKNPLTGNYIRRRYYYIEKCKDAQTLGLIVATLTSEGYLQVVARIQEMAKQRGIKTQIISVGRMNPAKLANFLEIDCFVLIGCPFNNMYTSKDYYKPIVSVFEAEMALNPAWHMKFPDEYVTDFKQLLPRGRQFMEFKAADIREQDISLVSGRMRHAGANSNDVALANPTALNEQQSAVVTQAKMELMTTNTGLTFEDRTWKGLDPALGSTEPAKLQKSLSGIPIKYLHEA